MLRFEQATTGSNLWLRSLSGIARAAPDALLNLVQPEQNTKLYRSYCQHGAATAVARHRGKSPRQAAFLFKKSGSDISRRSIGESVPDLRLGRHGHGRIGVCARSLHTWDTT
jgi:hypothetical protein